MKKKIDYQELKINFFASGFDEVKPFIQNELKTRNGQLAKKTTGRGKEKEKFKEAILNQALENSKEELEKRAEYKIKKIDNLYYKFILGLEERINKINELSIAEAYTLRKILRTEKGLTTNITKDPETEAKAELCKVQIVRTYNEKENTINEADLIDD